MEGAMKCRNFAVRGVVMGIIVGALLGSGTAMAQTMDQYYSVPPFVSDQVAPNILLILDNSGSMSGRSCDPTWCGTPIPATIVRTFVATNTYSGYFDPLRCYTYDAINTRFEDAAAKQAPIPGNPPVSGFCPAGGTTWDGNFLNWATFRRFDALKKSMTGGDCVVTRNADGTCPPSGTPAKITIAAQRVFDYTGRGQDTSNCDRDQAPPNGNRNRTTVCLVGIPSGGANGYTDRVPTSATPGTPPNLWIHLRGGTSGMGGSFCVDNDHYPPTDTATSCTGNQWIDSNNNDVVNSGETNTDSDAFTETQYQIRLVSTTEPTGVVQQIGAQARFGLFEFKGTGDGARMLVGIGSRQSIDFNGSFVETFTTNTAAMVDAVGESFPSTWTPLSESLYEAARYIAQINSTYLPGSYVYPIAYSPGVGLAVNGIGSLGTGGGGSGTPEITALTGSETCPAGYIPNACGRDPYFFGSNHTPAWATTSTQVRCCKTFVILVTDGEPTQDTNIPPGLQDYAHGQHGIHCTGADTSSPTAPINGTCNAHPSTTAPYLLGEHKTDYGSFGNHYLDDVAYWAHTNDLRPCNGTADGTIAVLNVTGHCLAGLQNISVYTFFAFGNIAGRELLMHAAQLGGFEDSDGNNIPNLTGEWDKVINATGAPGTDGIPDNYFESSNVDDLQERLMATITAILRKSASGTSISVLATSATGEGSIYQAYFFTSDIGQGGASVKWAGYTHALFIDGFGNFREDTVQDGVLNYQQDLIVTSRYDDNPASPTYQKVLVDKFADLNGDGVADSTTPTVTSDLKSIKPIWEAGKELALASSASRKILTWVDTDNDGLVDPGEQIDFSTANCAALRDYLRYAGDACAGSSNAMNLINFIRGDEVSGLRTRMLEVPVGSGSYSVWKLGDPIHSTPTIVSAPRSRFDLLYGDPTYTSFYQKYRNRRQVVYVGANDGMLHAFNGGYYHKGDDPTTSGVVEHGWYTKNPTDNSSGPKLGAERWSFVPYQLLPQLQWLARTDYTHVYYVDLKPTITEARIFTPDADHPDGWGTILIGGFRMGGSCGNCSAAAGAPPMTVTIGGIPRTFYSAYFALDITNPEVDPKLLWVFSDSGLGLTTSYPAVVRMNPLTDVATDKTNEKWSVIFGSGPNGYQADLPSTPSQTAKLYIVDLVSGPGVANANVTTMPIGSWRSFMGHVVTVDKDLDWRTDVAYSGRTIHDGSLPWRGKMYRLTMNCPTAPCSPSTWGISSGANRTPTEVIDTFLDAATSITYEVGPVAAAPAVTIDDANMMWVFFGTGRYFGNADKVDNSVQRLYGIKDSVLNNLCTQTSTVNCHNDDLVDVTSAVVCLICSGSTNQVTDPTNPGVTSFNGTGTTSMMGLVQSKEGWRVTLPGGSGTDSAERSVVNPTLIAGTIFFPTFVPTNDFCASSGNSYLYVLFYKTGTAAATPVVGTNVQGSNTNVTTKINLGSGLFSTGTMHGGESINLQGSHGNASQQDTTLGGFYSKYVSWVHQRD